MKSKVVLIMIIVILFFSLTGCNNEQNDSVFSNKTELNLPENNPNIINMKVYDEGYIIISGMEVNDDNSIATATAWQTTDGGKNWAKLYEKTFKSEAPGEILIEAISNFTVSDGIIEKVAFPKDDIFKMSTKMYYIYNFESGSLIEAFEGNEIGSLANIYIASGEEIYAYNQTHDCIQKLNAVSGEIKEINFPGASDIIIMHCDGKYIYGLYYLPVSEEDDARIKEEFAKNPEAVYAQYARGVKYDLLNKKVVESPVLDKFAAYYFQTWDETDYRYGLSFAANANGEKEVYYLLYDEGLIQFDENGKNLVYLDKEWDTNYGQLEILDIKDDKIYIQAFKHIGNGDEVKQKLLKITL